MERGGVIMRIDEYNYELPSTVYILGSGPNGCDAYSQIPSDAYVIAVNRACELHFDKENENINISAWMVADFEAVSQPYFANILRRFNGAFLFADMVVSKIKERRWSVPKDTITFSVTSHLTSERLYVGTDDRSILHSDFTVAGAAIEFCVHNGVTDIILCGVDMSGDADFKGDTPYDERHGEIWDARDRFENLIDYIRTEKGVKIKSLSETKLRLSGRDESGYIPKVAKSKLPSIGYLCMSHDAIDKMNAIVDCVNQDYPNSLKNLYILHQDPFPQHLTHDLPITITEIDVKGTWPELWLRKQEAFYKACHEDIMVNWDEDDRYSPAYTRHAIEPLLDGVTRITWTPVNRFMQNGNIVRGVYGSTIGSIAGYTETLRPMIEKMVQEFPFYTTAQVQPYHSSKRDAQVLCTAGALDECFRRMLVDSGIPVRTHHGERWYFFHSQTNTIQRDRGLDIDRNHASPKAAPMVGYLVMSRDPILARRTLSELVDQDYPNTRKQVYIIGQGKKVDGYPVELPIKVFHATIGECDDHTWWMQKMLLYSKMTRADVTLIIDEDDYYEKDYTAKAIAALRDGYHDAVWNYDMMFVRKNGIKMDKHSSAMGTLCAHTPVFTGMVRLVADRHPELMDYPQTKIEAPLDTKFRTLVDSNYNIGYHKGVRYYFWHKKMNSYDRPGFPVEWAIDGEGG